MVTVIHRLYGIYKYERNFNTLSLWVFRRRSWHVTSTSLKCVQEMQKYPVYIWKLLCSKNFLLPFAVLCVGPFFSFCLCCTSTSRFLHFYTTLLLCSALCVLCFCVHESMQTGLLAAAKNFWKWLFSLVLCCCVYILHFLSTSLSSLTVVVF